MRGAVVATLILAAAAVADVPEAHAAARRALVEDLAALAAWCAKSQIYRDRNETYELILRYDPDHREARKWLKYVLRKGQWVRETAAPDSRNMNAAAHAEYAGRRAGAGRRFGDAVVAALKGEGARWPRAARRAALEDIFVVDPDHAEARALNGQVRTGTRWVLEETARARERRKVLVAAARDALAKTPEPRSAEMDPFDARFPIPWMGTVETGTWRVVASTSVQEMREGARLASATVPLFEACFGVAVEPRPNQAIYLMAAEEEYRAMVMGHLNSTPKYRDFALKLKSSWIPETRHILIHGDDETTRLEFCARQPMDSLLRRKFGISHAQGWVVEGVGLYLTELLAGSRVTHFVRQTEYAPEDRRRQSELWRRIRYPGADWFEIGRDIIRGEKCPELAFVLSKDVNTMDAEDVILAYGLAAWLLEAQPERAPALLSAIGTDKIPYHDAIPKVLGLDFATLEERVHAWIGER